MARDSSGNYSLPAGNPVVAGTIISEVTHNATNSDIGTELTDSLSRSGKGGMLAPIRTVDGTAAAPAHSFTSETGTGLYRAGTNDVQMQVGGTTRSKWTASGFFADIINALTAVGVTIKGAVADGASAVAAIIDNTITLSTTGAKLLSIRNNTSEKAYVDKDGNFVTSGYVSAAGVESVTISASTGWTLSTNYGRKAVGLLMFRIAGSADGTATTIVANFPAGSRPPSGTTSQFIGSWTTGGLTRVARFLLAQSSGNITAFYYDSGGNIGNAITISNGDSISVEGCFPVA